MYYFSTPQVITHTYDCLPVSPSFFLPPSFSSRSLITAVAVARGSGIGAIQGALRCTGVTSHQSTHLLGLRNTKQEQKNSRKREKVGKRVIEKGCDNVI